MQDAVCDRPCVPVCLWGDDTPGHDTPGSLSFWLRPQPWQLWTVCRRQAAICAEQAPPPKQRADQTHTPFSLPATDAASPAPAAAAAGLSAVLGVLTGLRPSAGVCGVMCWRRLTGQSACWC